MNRRGALAALLAFGVSPRLSRGQGRVPTVGVLWIEGMPRSTQLASLSEGLRAQGYAPGSTIRIDERFLVEGYDALDDAARRLAAAKPDVIVAYGGTAIQAARKATATIPIVFVGGADPVRMGFAKSLSKPGANLTGLTAISSDLSAKRLELLREALPKIRRFAVVLYPRSAAELDSLRNYETAGRGLGLEVRAVEVRSTSDIGPVVSAISKDQVDAMAFVGSTLFRANAAQVASAAANTRLPAIYVDAAFAEAGGLMSYGPSLTHYFRQAAVYVDKILKGARPGDMPIEQPTRLELIVNLKAAREQGIALPRSLVQRADRVIE